MKRYIDNLTNQERYEKLFPRINKLERKIMLGTFDFSKANLLAVISFIKLIKSYSQDERLIEIVKFLEKSIQTGEVDTSKSYYRFKDGYIYSNIDFESIVLDFKSTAISMCYSMKLNKFLWQKSNIIIKLIEQKEIKPAEDQTIYEYIESTILHFLHEHLELKIANSISDNL